MERGIRALMCAAWVAFCLAGCSDRPTAAGTEARAVASAMNDAGAGPAQPPSGDLPDPYGLGNKTTAELRARLDSVIGTAHYYDLPPAKRAVVDSLLRFMARRRGYRSYEERAAFDSACRPRRERIEPVAAERRCPVKRRALLALGVVLTLSAGAREALAGQHYWPIITARPIMEVSVTNTMAGTWTFLTDDLKPGNPFPGLHPADTFMVVKDPAGGYHYNNDADQFTKASRLDIYTSSSSGTWKITVFANSSLDYGTADSLLMAACG